MKNFRLATLVAAIGIALSGCYSYEWAESIISSVADADASPNSPMHLQLGSGVELSIGVQANSLSVKCVGGLVIPGDFKNSGGNSPSSVIEFTVQSHNVPVFLDFDKVVLTYQGKRYPVQDVKLAGGRKDAARRVAVPANTDGERFLLSFPQVIDVKETFTLSLDELATAEGTPFPIHDLSFSPKTISTHFNHGERGC